MVRRRESLGSVFTFGGRVPAIVGGLLVALVGLTIFDQLGHGIVYDRLALVPAAVFRGEVFRLFTWSLLEKNAIGLVFAALWIWQTGAQLAFDWGPRRFAAVWFGLTAGSGLVQVLAAFLWAGANVPQASPWAVLVALLLMWAMNHPGAQLSWFGVLPMTTEMLRWVLLGGTALFAVFSPAPGSFVSNFAALLLAYVLAGPGLPFRHWWYRLRAEMHVQSARRRARAGNLRVVDRKSSDDRPRWMN